MHRSAVEYFGNTTANFTEVALISASSSLCLNVKVICKQHHLLLHRTRRKILVNKDIFSKEKKYFKMVPVFKISLFENESDNNSYYVLIQPRLPTFDSFKQAIYDRFPVLRNKPLCMYYYGK